MGGLLALLGIGSIAYNLGKEAYENARPVKKTGKDLMREDIERKFVGEENKRRARKFYGCEYEWEKKPMADWERECLEKAARNLGYKQFDGKDL